MNNRHLVDSILSALAESPYYHGASFDYVCSQSLDGRIRHAAALLKAMPATDAGEVATQVLIAELSEMNSKREYAA